MASIGETVASQTIPPRPNPELILDTLNAYQRTAALRATFSMMMLGMTPTGDA